MKNFLLALFLVGCSQSRVATVPPLDPAWTNYGPVTNAGVVSWQSLSGTTGSVGVSGPSSSTDNNLAAWNGTTGHSIDDSGIALANVVQSSRQVLAGTGLTGGGALSSDLTLALSPTGRVGVTTNSNAPATYLGETILFQAHLASTAVNLSASAVDCSVGVATCPSTGGTPSFSLTAGDWDIRGAIGFAPAATTSVTGYRGGISKIANTLPSLDTRAAPTSCEMFIQFSQAAAVPATFSTFAIPTYRCSLASTTTFYLVAQSTFTVSTMGVFGYAEARRVR